MFILCTSRCLDTRVGAAPRHAASTLCVPLMKITGRTANAPLGYWEGRLVFLLPFINSFVTFYLCCQFELFARLYAFWLHASPYWVIRTVYMLLRPPPRPPGPPTGTQLLFILPSYMEPVEVLRKTLDTLASHKRARESYTIILAMEARELETREGRDKLDSLFHEYGSGGHFKKVHSSTHELTAGEVASKCSNVSAAVRHAVAKLEPGLETKTIATIMDADSLLLEDYVERAAGLVMSAPECRPAMAWPPMAFPPVRLWLFGGDARLGNWVAGCFDSVWQIIVYSGAGRPTPVKMPVAVYSLRLDVLLDAGVDTTPEGVGEDMMMAMRAYTARGAHSVFVPVPFGSQRCKELKTRLRQTLRHAYGTVSLRYAAHSVLCRPGLGAIILLGQALEVSGFFAVMLWLATKGQTVFSQSTLFEQLLVIGAGLSSGGFSFFIQMRGFQVTKRDDSTPPVHTSAIAELGHSLCYIASFAIAAQVYAFLNLLAIVLMAIYGPAAVSHRPNTAA